MAENKNTSKKRDPDEERFIATGKSITLKKAAPGLARVKADMKRKGGK